MRRASNRGGAFFWGEKSIDKASTLCEYAIGIIIINKHSLGWSYQKRAGGMGKNVVIIELKYRNRSSGRKREIRTICN